MTLNVVLNQNLLFRTLFILYRWINTNLKILHSGVRHGDGNYPNFLLRIVLSFLLYNYENAELFTKEICNYSISVKLTLFQLKLLKNFISTSNDCRNVTVAVGVSSLYSTIRHTPILGTLKWNFNMFVNPSFWR